MKFVLLLAFLFMWLANPITGFLGFNNPEKWMKRAIRKLQRKTNAYGTMIASNTDEISNTAGFISTIDQCKNNYINDPDNGLSCCFEDNLNKGQCLCNGMTIDDTSNTGTCCMANKEHPDHCLCSGTDMDDPTNPGNCCFANSGQCLCKGNYTDVPSKRCFNLDWKGDGICDDQNNHGGCNFDGGDCCGDNVDTDLCTQCQCLEEEDPLPNAVGCCFKRENNSQECLCTGTQIDDPETPGSCCLDDVDNPGNCYRTCPDDCTNSSQGICDTSTGICDCKPGFAGHNCSEACTANQITYANICQDCSAGEVPDVMSNLTACVACNSEEITNTNNGSCQACPEGQVPNANQTVCEEATGSLILVLPGHLSIVKVYDMNDSVMEHDKCSDLKSFPMPIYASGGGLLGGLPVICGGGGGGYAMDECYSYDKASNSWILFANLLTGRKGVGAAIFKGALWLTGGNDENNQGLHSTEIIAPDGTVTYGPNLPNSLTYGLRGHCMAVLNKNKFMLVGGYWGGSPKNTITYDGNSGTFSNGPSMIYKRYQFACSVFHSKLHNGRKVLLVAGGEGDKGTAELLDYSQENAQWVEVDNLYHLGNPSQIMIYNGARSMPSITGDGVYLRFDRFIFLFTCDESSCQWTKLTQTDKYAIVGIMMPLPSDYTCE